MKVKFIQGLMIGLAFALWTGEVLAHASGRGFVLLLPTETMQFAGTTAVALSFALIAFTPAKVLHVLFREWHLFKFPLLNIETALSLLGLLFWTTLVVAGYIGARDPLANPLPLSVWTLLWVGFTFACAMFGNLWAVINPWSGVARLIGLGEPPLRLPDRVGYAPALLGLLAFGWFEIVDIAPDDPARLAQAVAGYWLFTLLGIVAFGQREWMQRGEFLNVFFGFIGRLAPVQFARAKGIIHVTAALPGAGLVNGPVPSMSGAFFILCALATVSYDGLSETWWWLAQIDVNPLEFPGRSAVVAENSFGLFAACSALTLAFAISLAMGSAITGRPPDLGQTIRQLSLSIIPISLAYHFAHYLVVLLVNGQYALATATDPLATGADWLGLGQFYVTTSFLNTQETVETIWRTQSGAIIIGHIIAVCVAHRIALDLWPTERLALKAQIPLALLMLGYTFFGLWLLASPTA